jgi:hypothetical protein
MQMHSPKMIMDYFKVSIEKWLSDLAIGRDCLEKPIQ